jgi:hypothetical protein
MSRRTRLLATLMIAPAILIAGAIAGVEIVRAQRPESPLFVTPVAYSLADAIQRNDVLRAYEFIRGGQNSNDVIPARDPSLTGERTVLVSPLEWAVATNSRDAALMLLGFGASVNRRPGRGAVCLADALGRTEMSMLLRTYSHEPGAPCPRLEPASAPLLAFLEPSR